MWIKADVGCRVNLRAVRKRGTNKYKSVASNSEGRTVYVQVCVLCLCHFFLNGSRNLEHRLRMNCIRCSRISIQKALRVVFCWY